MDLEISQAHAAQLGRVPIRRALPRRGLRTVGHWCFADHMGPADVTDGASLDVGPHPHIGLQTVTWLLDGQVLHRDSLGSEQVVRPGELNLMTSGDGVTHSEQATGHYRGRLEGIQLWVALPDTTRRAGAAFQHLTELFQVELRAEGRHTGQATVLVGSLQGACSDARHDTDHLGVDLQLSATTTLPLDPAHEHAVVVLRGEVRIDGRTITPGHMGHVAPGVDQVRIEVRGPARLVLIGGSPMPEPISMWWNFVARNHEEIDEAYRAWRDRDREGRFGHVTSPLPTIDAPTPPWWRAGQA